MWALLSSRLRTWVLLAVAVPALRKGVARLSGAARRRDADGILTAMLGRVDSLLNRHDRRRRTRGAKGGWL